MKKSIYRYAAEAGIPTGIYLTSMSACLMLSLRFPMLPSFIFPLMIGFPVLLGFLMKRIAAREPSYMKVPALWLAGIYTVIFGTLICMVFSAAYIHLEDPAFVYHYVTNAMAEMEKSPLAAEYASTISLMQDAIDARILPSGVEFVTTMGWATCFFGSVISLITASIISAAGRHRRKKGIDALNL